MCVCIQKSICLDFFLCHLFWFSSVFLALLLPLVVSGFRIFIQFWCFARFTFFSFSIGFFRLCFHNHFFSFLLTMFSSVDLQFSSICSLDFLSPHAKPYLFGMKSVLSSKRCCHKTHLNDRWFWWCQSVILGVRLLLNEPSETHQLWSENRFAETILRLI